LLQHESSLQIRIQDNGKGIPKERIANLGSRGNTFGKKSGSGLGLFHAKRTIESFGGKFDIESEEGHGTSIFITLPGENTD
jgi:signal transduction histidine kinase